MKSLHVISLAVLSDKTLTATQVSKIAEMMTIPGMVEKVLFISDYSLEEQVKEMIQKGIKEGAIGDAHIHIEQTEIEEDSMTEERCTCIKNISENKSTQDFAKFFRNCNYTQQQSILSTLSYLNENMLIPKSPKFSWTRIGMTKSDLINLVNIGNILKECVGR